MTYIHIPGHGWWYAVTVIDYYSRYLLACHFTPSYRATDVNAALDAARAEAERLHGPLAKCPFLVTDNGSSFLARAFRRHIDGDYAHVRIGYRTPTQLGLLERFHQTLKSEEVYWKLYASPGEARESLEVFRRRYDRSSLRTLFYVIDGKRLCWLASGTARCVRWARVEAAIA